MLPIILSPLVPIVEHFAVGIVLDRMATFRENTDWTKLEIDGDRKLRAFMPGEALDDTVVLAFNRAMRALRAALGEKAEAEKVLGLIAAGDFSGAAKELLAHAGASSKAA